MAELITSAEYDAIRKVIDVELNSNNLRDHIIALPIYEGAAVRDVLERVPSAASLAGDSLQRVKNAAIYFCAARLCPAVVRITSLSVQSGDLSYSRPSFNPEKRAAELRALAEAELAEVLTPDEVAPARPTMFAVARGTRGL